ncbi:hypothetical protein DICVIV_05461 [Dictyocaulus viviparus]|uniref:Protein kinase domain-containing protein n=1 Tax=Dictyocaulus viviparus TaxID=29172 RepID=A0A0D8Y1E1_DICVI|nr:hypothetical protein DICVIV_05461 [Dictyocaulus viviparus]
MAMDQIFNFGNQEYVSEVIVFREFVAEAIKVVDDLWVTDIENGQGNKYCENMDEFTSSFRMRFTDDRCAKAVADILFTLIDELRHPTRQYNYDRDVGSSQHVEKKSLFRCMKDFVTEAIKVIDDLWVTGIENGQGNKYCENMDDFTSSFRMRFTDDRCAKAVADILFALIDELRHPTRQYNYDRDVGSSQHVEKKSLFRCIKYLMGENEKKRNPQYRSISERSMKLDGYDSAIISCCVRIKPNLDFCVYDRFKDNNNQQGTVSSKEIIVSDGLSNIHEQVTACTSYVEHCGFQGTNVSGNSLQHDITAEVSAYVGYPRLLEKDEIRLGRLLKIQYRFLIMGSNTLKELKDAIKCPGDYQVFDDVSERRVNVDDLPKHDITAEVSAYVGYPRLLEKDEIRLGRLLKIQYRFLIMGSNTLKELKDAIKCPGDYQVFDDVSERRVNVDDLPKVQYRFLNMGSNTLKELKDAIKCPGDYQVFDDVSERRVNVDDLPKNRYPSSYFFIHDTFYIDLESKGAQDITEGIRTWARERGRGEMKVADMNTTRVVDLTCRLGAPYLYLHVGTCEHLICFNDLYLRIGHGLAGPHPIMFYESNQRRLACVGCRDNTAELALGGLCGIMSACRFPFSIFVTRAIRTLILMFFGKKVFKFEAAPYYDRHTKKSDPDLREYSDGNDGTELNERTTVGCFSDFQNAKNFFSFHVNFFREVMQKPNLSGLQLICSQVEAWENYMPSKVKDKAQKALTCLRSDGTLVGEEDMLRLYRILAKYSKRLGAQKVFEMLENEGTFSLSLKFYLLWAESCAESNDLRRFKDVLNLARRRLATLSRDQLEIGFRDLVDQYFPTSDLFNDEEETKHVFVTSKASDVGVKKCVLYQFDKPSFLYCSLARLESLANKTLISTDQMTNAGFAPNTRAKLRFVLIDRPDDNYFAPSIEEFRVAMLAEKQMADEMYDEPMDITTTHSETFVNPQSTSLLSCVKEVSKPPVILETVAECDSEISNEDKQRVVHVNESVQKSIPEKVTSSVSHQPIPVFITGSSFTEKAYNDMKAIFSDSVNINKGGGLPGVTDETTRPITIPEKVTSSVSHQPTPVFITGSSFTEKAYNDMKAIFSDSVNINKGGGLPGVTDETTRPISPPVFMDEHMSQGVREAKQIENLTYQRSDIFHGERIPLKTVPPHMAGGDSAKQKSLDVDMDNGKSSSKENVQKRDKTLIIDDEETMAGAKFSTLGIDKKPDFFAPLNNELEEQMKREEDEEALYAQSAFMRRRSLATLKCVDTTKSTNRKITPPPNMERSVEVALNNMKLGESKEVDIEMVEIGYENPSEAGGDLQRHIATGSVDPWDGKVRKEVIRINFFAPLNNELEEQMKREEDEEALYAQSAFMRRRSLATLKCVDTTKSTNRKITPPPNMERSVEVALNNMKLGESKEVDIEMVEIGYENPSEAGGDLQRHIATGSVDPWDGKVRKEVIRRSRKPCYQHDFDMVCPSIAIGRTTNLGGELYKIVALIGQGGFAKVYKSVNEEGKVLALKHETPSCAWEVHICSELRMRIGKEKRFTLDSVMEVIAFDDVVTEAYVFCNASVLFNEYYPHGTLLDISNKMHDPSWYIILLIAIQMAKVLRDIHSVEIIHGDVKPDNFVIVNKLNAGHNDVKEILNTPILKLIDWGRAIDMRVFPGQTFSIRGGTDKFDCPEMMNGRPWTYQTDYFGFVGTLHVVIFNKYAEVINRDGTNKLQSTIKRRLLIRPLLERIFEDFLNIPDCDHLPNWDGTIKAMETLFSESFVASEWHQAVVRFNSYL